MKNPKELIRLAGLGISGAFLLTGYALGLTLLTRKPASFSLESIILFSSEVIFYIVGIILLRIFIEEEK